MKPKNSQTLNFELIELTIDSLSFNGGRGVGRYEGVVVFVPNTAPNEVVRAKVTNKRSRFWEAELVEIVQPSPGRRDPPCPVAAKCGGCCWQHVKYSAQLTQKEKILSDSLRALAKLGTWETLPFLAAPDEYYYRSRIQLQVHDQRLGFFAKGTHEVVPINKCWISDSVINQRLKDLKANDAHGAQKIELALTESGELIETAGTATPAPTVFSQVNRAQNAHLKSRLVEFAVGRPDWILDLYSGTGNLTLPLREHFSASQISAVELSPRAVAIGRKLVPTVEWHAGDVGAVLRKMPKFEGRGLIVLDPPRTGCDSQVLQQLERLKPYQIVYVSCNPATFARDCLKLCETGRFKLRKVQGLDMFPQTDHVELIASLCAAT